MIDSMLSLAISMHSGKGVYALLLGSGVSRGAGILTGWEVVLDLVRKLSLLCDENCEPNPEEWYKRKFGEEPRYDSLLKKLGLKSERMRILKSYFEPTSEEFENGLKIPCAAHKAIAELVKSGHIRIIITTNFDRLLEIALENVGIHPMVIRTSDDIVGTLPLPHTECTVIKVHGDYLDTRIKNTPEELAVYSPKLRRFLARVFDEFGLVVCGWSGDYDTALRDALKRTITRRFSTFWCLRGEPGTTAEDLIRWRKAQQISIQSADAFFEELAEKVSALENIDKPHPMSEKVAVAIAKRFLADDAHFIRLHDFVAHYREHLYEQLSEKDFPIQGYFAENEGWTRIQRYETLTEILRGIVITGCFWGNARHELLWTRAIERIASPGYHTAVGRITSENLSRLTLYPALILLYAGGIAALAQQKFRTFGLLLTKSRCHYDGGEGLAGDLVNTLEIEPPAGIITNNENEHQTLSDHLCILLRDQFKEYLPADNRYEDTFDLFEYLSGLTYADSWNRQQGDFHGPIGRFLWRGWRTPVPPVMDIVDQLFQDVSFTEQILGAGLFSGSLQRFADVKQGFDDYIMKTWKQRRW